MPHVTVKHFPAPLDDERRARLAARITEALREAFGVDDGTVSIALLPVAPDRWDAEVYRPEIADRRDHLLKAPTY
ncbi:tautomerase family protein [Streptomyces sp. AD55]|uniref:tautomerase family protein n=1 Tax=Streptomyces sp. AD55 TaxID=3242895 RepID=UPI003528F836